MASVSKEIDQQTKLPLLKKRAYDRRLFTVDVGGKIATGSEVSRVSSVTATGLGRVQGSDDLTISGITHMGTEINFLCAGGTEDEVYRVDLRYETTSSEIVESVIAVGVV